MRSQAGLSGPRWGQEGYGAGSGLGWSSDGSEGGRERGTRRKKVFGYLKAANELRQTYQAQLAQKYQDAYDERNEMPPDFEPVTYGNEEMVLFPSYARRHVKVPPQATLRPESDATEDTNEPSQTLGDLEHWQREWDEYENDHAIVDIDVKGWIYSPHQGPMNRKNRILIALARRLSGIPAPDPNAAGDGDTGFSGSSRSRLASDDDASINQEANAIISGGMGPSGQTKDDFALSQNEIAAANAQLMERLSPFLTNPVAGLSATVFFFNDKQSQSRTVSTNAGGHFNLRVALDFVPSQVRVLAGEHLSATSEIKLMEPRGVSLISDIDDTIKHSAIASGAKEMFRNTFVRDLGELTVQGVKEWYARLAQMGVGIHYVSNSPWQLYPLLKSYFEHTGLPPGSFHLRQYSSMIQGLFEPTYEKKRLSLDNIIQDFPDRRFILVGDSGEADLEAYTELVVANPGKILGIFIRDVTTTNSSNFFDKSFSHLEKPLPKSASTSDLVDSSDAVKNRPSLPPRGNITQTETEPKSGAVVGQLIDFDSEDEKPASQAKQPPPAPPPKPANLRTGTTGAPPPTIPRKQVPPVPQKPSQLSSSKINDQSQTPKEFESSSNQNGNIPDREARINRHPSNQTRPSPLGPSSTHSRSKNPPPVPPPRRSTNNLSSPSPAANSTPNLRPPTSSSSSTVGYPPNQPSHLSPHRSRTPTPPTFSSPNSSMSPSMADTSSMGPNKREEMWKRRWARAQEILDDHGVVLASWKVGSDVQDLCVRVVEMAQRDESAGSLASGAG